MKRILALAALGLFIHAASAQGRQASPALAQQTTSDGDSLGAAADTSEVFTLPSTLSAFYGVVWADSVAIYTTQISKDGTHWCTADIDTNTVALPCETTANIGGAFAGWQVRIIIDGLWSTGKKLGKAYVAWSE